MILLTMQVRLSDTKQHVSSHSESGFLGNPMAQLLIYFTFYIS